MKKFIIEGVDDLVDVWDFVDKLKDDLKLLWFCYFSCILFQVNDF